MESHKKNENLAVFQRCGKIIVWDCEETLLRSIEFESLQQKLNNLKINQSDQNQETDADHPDGNELQRSAD